MGGNPRIVMKAQKNSEGVQFQLIADIELLQSSAIQIHFIPEFHSGLIKLNHFVVINSFSANPSNQILYKLHA
jgi:hypothetical protein